MSRLVIGIATALTACVPANEVRTQRLGDIVVHTLRLEYANAHVVQSGDASILVDTGGESTLPELRRALDDLGIPPSSLRAVVLTHGHADHAGAAHWLQRQGVPIIAGAGDAAMLARGANDELCPTDGAARDRLASDQAATYPPLMADVWVTETPIELGPIAGIDGRVVSLPNHTPGSLVVLIGAEVALVGDLVRGEILSDGADVHFYQCDLAGNRAAMRRLLDSAAPRVRHFYPGHFGPLTRGHIEDLLREQW